MKKICRREIRHIIANYSIKNQSTAYCFKSKSIILIIIRILIKHDLMRCEKIDGRFIFVTPSEKLIKDFSMVVIEAKMPVVQSLQRYLNWNISEETSPFSKAQIAGA